MTKFALIAIAAVGFASSQAVAQPVLVTGDSSPVPSERVSYADLNIGSAAGQARLKIRIDAAAARICGYQPNRTSLDEFLESRACFFSAKEDGRRQMETAVAANQSGVALAATSLTISRK